VRLRRNSCRNKTTSLTLAHAHENVLYRFDFGRNKGTRIDEVEINYLQFCVKENVYSTRKDLRAALIFMKLLPFESQERSTEVKVLGMKRKLQGEGGEGGSGAGEQS
jgi:hypothetical protein